MHKPIHANNLPKPVGPYSPGMEFERLIFVSGQGAIDPATGKLAGATVEKGTAFAPRPQTSSSVSAL